MYVVVEFNQAGGWPRIAEDSIHMVTEDADRMAAVFAEEAAEIGRGERYAVFELVEVDD